MRIVSQAPTRISLFGGSTDLPVFYKEYGGIVISMAVNLRQIIEITHNEKDQFGNLEIPQNANPAFYKTFLDEFGFSNREMGIKATSDIPIQSGLGSSASAAVALVGSLVRLTNVSLPYPIERWIAEKAWDIEVNRIGLYGGKQDQYAASFGGLNQFIFNKDGYVEVHAYPKFIDEKIVPYISLFDTGIRRSKPKIQENLKLLSDSQVSSLKRIEDIAVQASDRITDVEWVGHTLDKYWQIKKKSNPDMTNFKIDEIYESAKKVGAMGGKLMGSGGGGFMFFVSDIKYKNDIKEKLEIIGCKQIDFSIDRNGLETRIIK